MSNENREFLQTIARVEEITFPDILQQCLDEANLTKSGLHEYLYNNHYCIEKTSIYRYFNPTEGVSRMPDEEFLGLFADYVGLDDRQYEGLCLLYQLKRKRKATGPLDS